LCSCAEGHDTIVARGIFNIADEWKYGLERMLPRSLPLLMLFLISVTACQTTSVVTPTPAATPTPQTTPDAEASPEPGYWRQVEVEDVTLGLQVPHGWKTQTTDHGLLIAEKFGSIQSGTQLHGMQVYLFVYEMDAFDLPATPVENEAWAALKQVIEKPDMIGNATVSEPAGFDWDGHDAAYYLFNDGDGGLSMLLAVAISSPPRLVVCNFTAPAEKSTAIRQLLPQLLSTLSVNGDIMDSRALHELPDPLEFPAPKDSS
jgi:hypothetical protein